MENLVLVEDLDGVPAAGADVGGQLDLAEIAFSERFPQLVLPNSHSSSSSATDSEIASISLSSFKFFSFFFFFDFSFAPSIIARYLIHN